MQNYSQIIVESFIPEDRCNGLHGHIHIRPCPDQDPFLPEMFVQCSKNLSTEYPVGTKFSIKAKISSREGSRPFVYSSYKWHYDVV